jgi:hypothetical protein
MTSWQALAMIGLGAKGRAIPSMRTREAVLSIDLGHSHLAGKKAK